MNRKPALCTTEIIHEEAVNTARERLMDEEELYNLAEFFKVLGDSTRVRILCALDASEMCVCDLSALLSMTMSAISHQLKGLKQANLVRHRRQGKTVFYALSDDHVRDIVERGLEHIRER